MNEDTLFKLAVQNPYLSAAVFVLALGKIFQLVLENQRHKHDKGNNKAIVDTLKASAEQLRSQTDLLRSLTESSSRQEGSLITLAASQSTMTTNMAVAMDRQQTTAKDVDHIRSNLPTTCKYKSKGGM